MSRLRRFVPPVAAVAVGLMSLGVAPKLRADDGLQSWSLTGDFPTDVFAYTAADISTHTWLYQTSRELQPGLPLDAPANYFPLATGENDTFGGHDLRGFHDPFGFYMDTPFCLINRTGQEQDPTPNIVWPDGWVGGSVLPTHPLVVSWKSPITGFVTVEGELRDFQTGHGRGINWRIIAEPAGGGGIQLASGQIGDGGEQAWSTGQGAQFLETINVVEDAKIHLYVENSDPADNDDNIFGIRFNVRQIPVPAEIQKLLDANSPPRPVSQRGAFRLQSVGDPVNAVFGTVNLQVADLEVGGLLSVRRLARTYKSSYPEQIGRAHV